MTLDAKELACVRGGREIFTGLEFCLSPGELLVVKGPNGSGKSSLLRMIAGFLPPAAGAVLWGGVPISDDRENHGRQTSYVGHLDAVKPALTVHENLIFWAGMGGGDAVEGRIKTALSRLRLTAQSDLPAGYLSAGQRRRLNLARLIADPTALWLLDEPTAALDNRSVEIVAGLIDEHCAGGGMAIAATHLDLGLPAARELNLADFQFRARLELVL
ncbi:MAG: heme ABC exporter ATP-binding protein CcmA [Rhodospirillales bacterium]|nr:heme ABC exporter ATP-binding protein CcmA [Rhodospirillales bacterium]